LLLTCRKIWHGADSFSSPPKIGMLQIFIEQKIHRLGREWTREPFFPWRWGGSSTQAWMLTYVSILRIPQMIWVWRGTVEWYWQGKTEELGENPVPVPLCPPQIPNGLNRARTRASAVRDRRPTTSAMARPPENLWSNGNHASHYTAEDDLWSITYHVSINCCPFRKHNWCYKQTFTQLDLVLFSLDAWLCFSGHRSLGMYSRTDKVTTRKGRCYNQRVLARNERDRVCRKCRRMGEVNPGNLNTLNFPKGRAERMGSVCKAFPLSACINIR
jgi:hypothetical protein